MLIELTSKHTGELVLIDPAVISSVSPLSSGGCWVRRRSNRADSSSGGPDVKESAEEVRDMIKKAGIEIRRGKETSGD